MAENYFQIRLWTLCFRSDLVQRLWLMLTFVGYHMGDVPLLLELVTTGVI